jgi:hypothetical protein
MAGDAGGEGIGLTRRVFPSGLDLAPAEIAEGAGVRYDNDVAAACIRLFRAGRFSFST